MDENCSEMKKTLKTIKNDLNLIIFLVGVIAVLLASGFFTFIKRDIEVNAPYPISQQSVEEVLTALRWSVDVKDEILCQPITNGFYCQVVTNE